MTQLPLSARMYLVVCYLLGAAALGWMVLSGEPVPGAHGWGLAGALAVLAAAAEVFVVHRARSNHTDHLTPAPVFAAFLLLPAPLLALVVVFTFVPEWIVYRRRWFIQTFNIASWLIAAALGRWALSWAAGEMGTDGSTLPLPAPAVLLAMPVFLGAQTLLLSTALKLARGHSYRESGLFAPSKLFVEFALLCCGWAFAGAWITDPLYGLAAAVPLVLIFQSLHVPNLKEEASTDPKTGLANMRHFNALVERGLERAERTGDPLSLLMCDLDFLRNINNTYGHQAGDVVLQVISDIIRRTIRGCDVGGRFGGEEFVVMLADTDSAGAASVAERLRRELEESRFEVAPGQSIGATISIGVASCPVDGRTLDVLLREADLAVYQAKREGRNRVVVAGRASRELAGEWAQEHLVPREAPGASSVDQKLPFHSFIRDVTRLAVVVQAQPSVEERRRAAASEETPRNAAASPLTDRAETPQLGWAVGVIAAVCVAGVAAFGLSVWWHGGVPTVETVPWGALAFFALLTLLAEQAAVDIGQKRGKISVSAVAVLGAGFAYGDMGSLAAVSALAAGAAIRARSPFHRTLFNFGNALLAAVAANWVFAGLGGRSVTDAASVTHASFARMLIPAVLAGLAYYGVHIPLLCMVRGLAERQRPWLVWAASYQWLMPHFAVLGALGLVVAVAHTLLGWPGVLALLAPLAMMQLAIKQYMDRTRVYVAELQRANARVADSYEATLSALTTALDTRDEETEEHSQRVRHYAELIARRVGMAESEIEQLSRGALLHDIGKIGVPDAILLKQGALSDDERAAMRKHPAIGYSMIAHIPFLGRAAEVVLHHHEAYDGSGYPSRLAGEQIPLAARVFTVADAFDAMTCDRPYRLALPEAFARAEIERCRGAQFDPQVVDAFLSISTEALMRSVPEALTLRTRQAAVVEPPAPADPGTGGSETVGADRVPLPAGL